MCSSQSTKHQLHGMHIAPILIKTLDVDGIMDLIDALDKNGFAKNCVTLNSVIANTMQDGQYSAEARENSQILMKYASVYGNFTIEDIRSLFA